MANIVCISMTTWNGDYMKTIVHMMGRLAHQNKILFVDYGFTWKDLIWTICGKSKAPIRKMLGIDPRLVKVTYQGNELQHLTLPPLLPINWIPNRHIHDFLSKLQMRVAAYFIRSAMRVSNIVSPTVINAFNPVYGIGLRGQLNEKATIYYCYDEISSACWCKQHGGRLEVQFLKKVDLVVATSSALQKSKSRHHSNVKLIENGVDFPFFHTSYPRQKRKPRPLIGYIGSVDSRLDYQLLDDVITQNEHCDFAIVGRLVSKEASQMAQYPNVNLTGPVDVSTLPEWLGRMDCAIIPFKCDEFNRNIYPLKINEYFAAGLPVVSTAFANLSPFEKLIYVADTATDFTKAIRHAYRSDSTHMEQQRIAFARKNDWALRVNILQGLIHE
ncbi:MAG: glycosyltransferase [Cyclobacteriaceae bacterium]|nr:glycosyltransferase [Cyclobacteriaceae bacterium HetDA_MAG_MS6]